ncbi:MAG: DUF1015 domain-containing protein [Thermoleophilaceae bacterium]
MTEVLPLRALRYELGAVGSLDRVAAPPYDVIDARMRAELAARSPFNVVEIDLPEADGGDAYLHAETTLQAWRQQGIVVRESEEALWALTQHYTGPDGRGRTRRGFFARVRVEEYGPGRIRPHERTHPGPKEDRLRLTRATRANLSPIFSLFPDADGRAWRALEATVEKEPPFGALTDADGTEHTLWRVGEPDAVEEVRAALADAELLIADGHHRYETARIYAEEIGGEGPHRYVLMFLCSLSDPGLTVFPTHRLIGGLGEGRRAALREAVESLFEVSEVAPERLEPGPEDPGVAFGYLDAFHGRALRLTLRDHAAVEHALAGYSEAYRRLDTAVLEALILRGALGMSEDDISHLRGISYSKDARDAREALADGRAEAAFFMRPTPIDQVREIARAGESMPPKSTYFFPKVPTGLLFNPLD